MSANQKAVAFFYENAGVSYDPLKESYEDGKQRGAEDLAEAEARATAEGFRFAWEHDDITNEEHENSEEPYYYLWVCTCYAPAGAIAGSLGGIDLGPEGTPGTDRYARVVEAELAREALL